MSFSNFKKISNELDAGISEQELKNILDASTQNGKELTFEEFEEYMKSSEK
jgi:Ca2+-binding EF-hand superfamily protein